MKSIYVNGKFIGRIREGQGWPFMERVYEKVAKYDPKALIDGNIELR